MNQVDMNDYVYQPMLSYLGNKRKILPYIEKYVDKVKPTTVLDGFCGSGVVSRLLKKYSKEIIVNDLEEYSVAIQKTYLPTLSLLQQEKLKIYIDNLNEEVDALVGEKKVEKPFISRYYSPKDSNSIQLHERCFYSSENALRIDAYIQLLKKETNLLFRDIAIGNLLVKCSINTNTSGVFKAFYKVNNIGHWGGYKEHDLQRILRPITIEPPLLLNNNCSIIYSNNDIIEFWKKYNTTSSKLLDFVYYDPPYNQHPYGSNYFMLNVIYKAIVEPDFIQNFKIDEKTVSGIPKDWNRSQFNYKHSVFDVFKDMILNTKAKFLLISYNSNGLISKDSILEILNKVGKVSIEEIVYKNLNSRPNKKMLNKVNEYLFFVETF